MSDVKAIEAQLLPGCQVIIPGHLGQTVVYVIILVSSVAVLSEVYGDLLRAERT